MLGSVVDGSFCCNDVAVVETGLPQRSTAHPALIRHVDLEAQFARPLQLRSEVPHPPQELVQQRPRYLFVNILEDSNRQSFIALLEEAVRDGLGRMEIQIRRNFVNGAFHNLRHLFGIEWVAETCEDQIDRCVGDVKAEAGCGIFGKRQRVVCMGQLKSDGVARNGIWRR